MTVRAGAAGDRRNLLVKNGDLYAHKDYAGQLPLCCYVTGLNESTLLVPVLYQEGHSVGAER